VASLEHRRKRRYTPPSPSPRPRRSVPPSDRGSRKSSVHPIRVMPPDDGAASAQKETVRPPMYMSQAPSVGKKAKRLINRQRAAGSRFQRNASRVVRAKQTKTPVRRGARPEDPRARADVVADQETERPEDEDHQQHEEEESGVRGGIRGGIALGPAPRCERSQPDRLALPGPRLRSAPERRPHGPSRPHVHPTQHRSSQSGAVLSNCARVPAGECEVKSFQSTPPLETES
jgi:hypothetical protein